jgi:hypothetical protein
MNPQSWMAAGLAISVSYRALSAIMRGAVFSWRRRRYIY